MHSARRAYRQRHCGGHLAAQRLKGLLLRRALGALLLQGLNEGGSVGPVAVLLAALGGALPVEGVPQRCVAGVRLLQALAQLADCALCADLLLHRCIQVRRSSIACTPSSRQPGSSYSACPLHDSQC